MRKHALSGLFFAASLGLSLHAGAGQALAEDGADLFPPEMLQPAAPKAPVVLPAPSSSATAETAPAAPAPVVVATSVPMFPVASAPITFITTAPQKSVTASRRAEARVIAHRRHVRHLQHARAVPAVLPPVRMISVTLPSVRVAQSNCAGFCGKYVLVGVGF